MLAPHRSELYFKRTKTYRTTKDWGVGVVKTPATERCTECVMPDARGTGRGVTKQEIGESGDEIKRMGDKRAGRADGPPRAPRAALLEPERGNGEPEVQARAAAA
jgi:hypothetical protein